MRTTGIQVSGFGFLLRRLELALVIGDPRMAHDPLRNQRRAVFVGLLVSLLIAGGAVMLGLLKPAPSLDGDLVADETGSLHVRLGEAFHPVSNVASARLILGSPAEVSRSTAEQLAQAPSGPPVGIGHVPGLATAEPSDWFLCSTAAPGGQWRAHVVALPRGSQPQHRYALLESSTGTWLVNGATRTAVDPVAARAWGVETVVVSDAVAEQFSRTTDPRLPSGDSGLPAPFSRAGELFMAGERLFIVVQGGVAELTGARRDYAEALNAAPVQSVGLREVLAQPGGKALQTIPADPARSLDWAVDTDAHAHCAGSAGMAQLDEATAGSDYRGPRGSSPVVTERGIAIIDDAGLRYSVGTLSELKALGFADPVEVPWRLISGLPDAGLLSESMARRTITTTATSANTKAMATGTE